LQKYDYVILTRVSDPHPFPADSDPGFEKFGDADADPDPGPYLYRKNSVQYILVKKQKTELWNRKCRSGSRFRGLTKSGSRGSKNADPYPKPCV